MNEKVMTMETEDGTIEFVVPLHNDQEREKSKHDFYEFLLKLITDNELKKSKTA